MIIVSPTCTTVNRVPADRLAAGGKGGRCASPLLQGQPVVLTDANFDAHTGKSDVPLLVDFSAPWCGPCRQMAPAFAAAASQLEPYFRLAKVDTEAEPGFGARLSIRPIPTLVLFQRRREIARQARAMPASAIVDWARSAHMR